MSGYRPPNISTPELVEMALFAAAQNGPCVYGSHVLPKESDLTVG